MLVFEKLMTKSEAAWRMSCDTLSKRNPDGLYFWTFTPWCVMADWQFARAWRRLEQRLWKKMPVWWEGIEGLRVFEPFDSGFLHCHALLNKYINVDSMRRWKVNTGIGRIHVRRAREGDGDYLAKYLAKAGGKLASRVRMWGKIGDWQHTRKNRVVIESDEACHLRAAYRVRFGHVENQVVRFMLARRWVAEQRAQAVSSGRENRWALQSHLNLQARDKSSYDVVTAAREFIQNRGGKGTVMLSPRDEACSPASWNLPPDHPWHNARPVDVEGEAES